jgi:serine/threonine protein kinase
MGEVYQATDSKLGRSVAIKLLPEAFTHDAERAARFEREARVLASLNHPNIAASAQSRIRKSRHQIFDELFFPAGRNIGSPVDHLFNLTSPPGSIALQ